RGHRGRPGPPDAVARRPLGLGDRRRVPGPHFRPVPALAAGVDRRHPGDPGDAPRPEEARHGQGHFRHRHGRHRDRCPDPDPGEPGRGGRALSRVEVAPMRQLWTLGILILTGTTAAAADEPAGDARAANARLGRGINLGNALEAPNEGEWGVRLKPEYFAAIK